MPGTLQHGSQALISGNWIWIPALFVTCFGISEMNVFSPCEMLNTIPNVLMSRKSESTWNPFRIMPHWLSAQ